MAGSPDRPTLTQDGLAQALSDIGWPAPRVVAATGSTNADLLAAASGAAEGSVLAADEQTSGRGRLGRQWVSPAGSSVSVSVLLRPPGPVEQLGWLPLLTGLSVAAGISAATGVEASVKWPNDVLVTGGRPGKIAGILLEVAGGAAVVGFGINTAMTADELPVPEASSIVLAGGARPDPDLLVAACLRELHRRYTALVAAGMDAGRAGTADEYRSRCTTIGRTVTVAQPGGATLQGRATGVDDLGRLLVDEGGAVHTIAAGDVAHVR